MSYCPKAHRQFNRERCKKLLVEGGPAWFDYVKGVAIELEREQPLIHRGLLAEVQAFIEAARVAK